MTQTSLFNQELSQLQNATCKVKIDVARTQRNSPLKRSALDLANTMEALLSGDPALVEHAGLSSRQLYALGARLGLVAAILEKRGR